ncbi:MAG: hypothetical protein IJR13_07700 [Bacteroidales bacterium]|nr:hypothetical protein [Bacteroidales bacterium]
METKENKLMQAEELLQEWSHEGSGRAVLSVLTDNGETHLMIGGSKLDLLSAIVAGIRENESFKRMLYNAIVAEELIPDNSSEKSSNVKD